MYRFHEDSAAVPGPLVDVDFVLEQKGHHGVPILLARHVLPGMKERGFGRILNIGSVAGGLGASGQVAYSTAKAGLEGLTRSIAAECGRRGVTCNLIEPGLIASERAMPTRCCCPPDSSRGK